MGETLVALPPARYRPPQFLFLIMTKRTTYLAEQQGRSKGKGRFPIGEFFDRRRRLLPSSYFGWPMGNRR